MNESQVSVEAIRNIVGVFESTLKEKLGAYFLGVFLGIGFPMMVVALELFSDGFGKDTWWMALLALANMGLAFLFYSHANQKIVFTSEKIEITSVFKNQSIPKRNIQVAEVSKDRHGNVFLVLVRNKKPLRISMCNSLLKEIGGA